jgi:hypothetical protein
MDVSRRPHSRWHDLATAFVAVGAVSVAFLVVLIASFWTAPDPLTATPSGVSTRPGQVSADTGSARATPPSPQVRVVRASASPAAPAGEGGAAGEPIPDVDAALACIRAHESDTAGGYQAVNASSGAAGAYQLMPALSDDWARRYGHPKWAGVTADQWPPAVQDSVAAQLYTDWPGAWQGSGC